MPKGKKHDQLILQFLPVNLVILFIIGLALPIQLDIYGIMVVFFYLFGGYYFSPDLDIDSSVYRRWKFLKFLWLPYKNIVPHRSIFSHGFVIGTLTRIVYLFSIISSILLFCTFILTGDVLVGEYLNNVLDYLIINRYYIFSIFIALELSADVHILADRMQTKIKKNVFIPFKKGNH